jgi:hypothetical protein
MGRLALEPEVTAAVVVTDGWVVVAPEPPPYHVLWALVGRMRHEGFAPGYGTVLRVAG